MDSSRRSDPQYFGAAGGMRIVNFDTIMSEIDAALGVSKPPAVEYLFVAPYGSVNLFGLRFGSPYGHAALRYTLPQSEADKTAGKRDSRVMNIVKGNALEEVA